MFKRGAKAITFDKLALDKIANTKRCYELTDRQVAMLYNAAEVAGWKTRWTNATSGDVLKISSELKIALISAKNCNNGKDSFPLQWDGQNLTIECEEDMIVNFYGCGCGCGETGQALNNASGTASGFGQNIVNSAGNSTATPCDIAAYIVPYIFKQAVEFVEQVKALVDLGETAPDAITDALGGISLGTGDIVNAVQETFERAILQSENQIISALDDIDLILEAQIAFIGVFGSNSQITSFTREELRQWTFKLPNFWGTVIDGFIFLPSVFMTAFVQVMNMQKLNNRIPLSKGASNEGLCTLLYEQSGAIRPSTLPQPQGLPELPIVLNAQFWLSQEYVWADTFLSPNTSDRHEFNDFSGKFPGCVGVYIESSVISSGNGNLALLADGTSITTQKALLEVQGVSQDRALFWGDSGNESLWTKRAFVWSGPIDSVSIASGVYNLIAETTGNTVDITWNLKIRLLIDRSVQAFDGAIV